MGISACNIITLIVQKWIIILPEPTVHKDQIRERGENPPRCPGRPLSIHHNGKDSLGRL